MNKTIGVIGLGFVGDALKNGFEHFGLSEIAVHDPKLGTSITAVEHCDVVFVCVPTPMGNGGVIDDSIVKHVLDDLVGLGYNGVVVIKSTLLPTSVHKFIEDYDLRIMTNPEYLTERCAREDFINTKWVILGGAGRDIAEVREIYEYVYRDSEEVKYSTVTAEAAMMAKYMTNTWFSVKVALMNEYHELWTSLLDKDAVAGDWDDLVDAFSHDVRVGPTHLQVPGPDGDFGFGGKCFPKDLNALISLVDEYNTTNRILIAAWNDNSDYRKNKDWLEIDGAVSEDYIES